MRDRRPAMAVCVAVLLATGLARPESAAARAAGGAEAAIRYGAREAELTLARVSARTLELRLSPIGADGRPAELPESNILIDHPRVVEWSGRTVDGVLERRIGELRVEVRTSPLTVTIYREDGTRVQELSWPDADGAMHFRIDAPVFGLGEGHEQFDRRGHRYSMRDGNARYRLRTHGAYIAVPMLIGLDGWAMFVHHPISRRNAFDLEGDVGRFEPAEAVRDRALKLYVIAWDEPAQALFEYRRIAGATPMPPRWALGYMQSHRTLESADQIRRIARKFRERNLPADALIYLGTGFAPTGWNVGHGTFEFNRVVFDEPAAIIDDLHALNYKVILHVYSPPRGLHGTSLDAATDEENHIRNYWALHAPVFELGVDGWWSDGGENLSSESRVARHRMYRLGPLSDRPNQRPWSLHRTGYSGAHRYGGWIWSGDPSTTWETLETHIAVALNHSVSLTPYWGSDIAGFVPTEELTGELYIRWFQFAAFTPSFRAHGRTWQLRLPWGWNTGGIGPAESSIFEEDGYPHPGELRNGLIEPIARQYLQLRYRLLPYNYTLAREAYETGLPLMRALWLHYPDDPEAARRGDQYLWGRDLLVAPVHERGATERTLYLPEGEWYDLWTNERLAGGREVTRRVDLATLPLYVRAGAIVPFDPVRQYTSQPVDEPTTFRIYPGRDGAYRWYRDDGATLDYERGEYSWTRLRWHDESRRLVIEPDPDGGGRAPAPATLRFLVMSTGATSGVARTIEWDGSRREIVFPTDGEDGR